MNDTLTRMIKQLRLGGMLESLEVRLQEARGNNLSHEEFLELILQDESNIRQQRLITRRIKAASFRDLKTLEDFDLSLHLDQAQAGLRPGQLPVHSRSP